LTDEIVQTGIHGLDEVLHGGFLRGRSMLLCGGPGTGKTIFSIQFLYNGVSDLNENGIYVTLDEKPDRLIKDMYKIGFDVAKVEKEGKLKIVDYSSIMYLTPIEYERAIVQMSAPTFKVESLAEVIKKSANEINAKRIVIDSMTALFFQEPDAVKRRLAMRLLFKTLEDVGCTSIVVSEARAGALQREFQIEEYLAQGVIVLRTIQKADTVLRGIYVEKMRGMDHDMEIHPYRIGKEGIRVFGGEKILIDNESVLI
jgi:KaiC/GvpD/RAD55 family RecA-like ATPase